MVYSLINSIYDYSSFSEQIIMILNPFKIYSSCTFFSLSIISLNIKIKKSPCGDYIEIQIE